MNEANEVWADVESWPGATTRILNNYSRSPTRFRVITAGGSAIEFTLVFGFTAEVKNRGDITSIQLKNDGVVPDFSDEEDQADDQ